MVNFQEEKIIRIVQWWNEMEIFIVLYLNLLNWKEPKIYLDFGYLMKYKLVLFINDLVI